MNLSNFTLHPPWAVWQSHCTSNSTYPWGCLSSPSKWGWIRWQCFRHVCVDYIQVPQCRSIIRRQFRLIRHSPDGIATSSTPVLLSKTDTAYNEVTLKEATCVSKDNLKPECRTQIHAFTSNISLWIIKYVAATRCDSSRGFQTSISPFHCLNSNLKIAEYKHMTALVLQTQSRQTQTYA